MTQSDSVPPKETTTVVCEECGVVLAADSAELRLELTSNDESIPYCATCWEREFGNPTGT